MPQSWIKVTVPSDFQSWEKKKKREKKFISGIIVGFIPVVSDQDLAKHDMLQMHFTTKVSMEHGTPTGLDVGEGCLCCRQSG